MGDMSGIGFLEMITYHCLAISFIAMGLRKSEKKGSSKQITLEIFNTGLTTVSTYLIQTVFGIIITAVAALYLPTMISLIKRAG